MSHKIWTKSRPYAGGYEDFGLVHIMTCLETCHLNTTLIFMSL